MSGEGCESLNDSKVESKYKIFKKVVVRQVHSPTGTRGTPIGRCTRKVMRIGMYNFDDFYK